MEQSWPDYDRSSKVLIVGDSGTGKSCLVMRFANDEFTSGYRATIGVEFMAKTVQTHTERVKLQLWDTAGQEHYRCISQNYFRGAQGVIIVYDPTDEASFNSVHHWFKQVESYCDEQVSKVLVASKSDREDKVVEASRGEVLADSLDMKFFEISAKNNTSVDECFQYLAEEISSTQQIKQVPTLTLHPPEDTHKVLCCNS